MRYLLTNKDKLLEKKKIAFFLNLNRRKNNLGTNLKPKIEQICNCEVGGGGGEGEEKSRQ